MKIFPFHEGLRNLTILSQIKVTKYYLQNTIFIENLNKSLYACRITLQGPTGSYSIGSCFP